MDRRSFLIKSSLAGAGGFLWLQSNGLQAQADSDEFQVYNAETPPYALDALEPFIDQKTMDIHFNFHHKAYSRNLNTSLQSSPEQYRKWPLEKLFEGMETLPEPLQTAVRNHGGGHWNHNFFWKCMTAPGKDQAVAPKLSDLINRDLGGIENFKKEFTTAALSVFGSGWAWLVWNGVKVEILKTPNQENPLMNRARNSMIPLLGVDVWEHAYYLKCQNRRAEYLDNFWKVINWDFVSSNLPA
jgi:Fe-Mn family superoxide dismutase